MFLSKCLPAELEFLAVLQAPQQHAKAIDFTIESNAADFVARSLDAPALFKFDAPSVVTVWPLSTAFGITACSADSV